MRLRLITADDLELTRNWRNQDHIRRWFVRSDPISQEQQAAWFQQYQAKSDDYTFIIEDRANDLVPVGQAALYDIDTTNRTAQFGRLMIGEDAARGRGFAQEATRLLIQLAFQEFNMRRIYLRVFEDNQPALKIYLKCGFVIESQENGMVTMALYNPKG